MKQNKAFVILMLFSILTFASSVTAYADSSWHWISKTRPYDILPFVVIGTLFIETIAINYMPKIHKLFKVFCVVTLGNVLSYLAPYALYAFEASTYTFGSMGFERFLAYFPSYSIGIIYLLLTIGVELPVVFFLLRKNTDSNKALFLTIVGSNIITTALVAIVERVICIGLW